MRILSIDRAKQKAKGPSHGGSPARGRNRIPRRSSTPDGSRLSPTAFPRIRHLRGRLRRDFARLCVRHLPDRLRARSLPIPAAARTHARAAFAAFVLVAVLLAGFPSTALAASDVADPSSAQGAPANRRFRRRPGRFRRRRHRPGGGRRSEATMEGSPFALTSFSPLPGGAATARRAKATRAIATTSPASPAAWWPSLPKA